MRGRPRWTIRGDDKAWEDFGVAAERAGADRSELVRQFVDWYRRKPGARMPKRPDPAGQDAES